MKPAPRKPTAAGALLALALLCPGCAAPPAGDDLPPNLILITVDTLRADHLESYGYFRETSPNLAALAREGLLFENVIAPMATTLPSHASLLTSSYPARHGILSNFRFFRQPVQTGDELMTAAQLLRGAGYQTAAFTSSSPLSEATGIDAGFETFVGPPSYDAGEERIDVPAEETISRALDWLDGATPPFFLWVHLFDPHTPYGPPPPYDSAHADGPGLRRLLAERGFPDRTRDEVAPVLNLYDGEISYADHQIGRLLRKLRYSGLDAGSITVFTADHGEGLYQHGILEHGWIWNEQIRVPLIIRFPDGRTGRVPGLTSLLDVLPILAEESALPLDSGRFDGIDVLREDRETALSQREIREDVWRAACFTLTGRGWKYWYLEDRADMLFDLRRDPREARNVIADHPEVAHAMREELLELVRDSRSRSSLQVSDDVPEHLRRQLRALGYVD